MVGKTKTMFRKTTTTFVKVTISVSKTVKIVGLRWQLSPFGTPSQIYQGTPVHIRMGPKAGTQLKGRHWGYVFEVKNFTRFCLLAEVATWRFKSSNNIFDSPQGDGVSRWCPPTPGHFLQHCACPFTTASYWHLSTTVRVM